MDTINWDWSVFKSITWDTLLSTLGIFLLCLIAIRILLKLTDRVLRRAPLEERVKLLSRKGIHILLWVLTVLILADSLGLPVTSLVALVSVLSLAISLAMQDILADIAGGIVLMMRKPFKPGDYVEIQGREGTVVDLELSHTMLETVDGLRILLPNKSLSTNEIVNYTALGRRRIDHALCVCASVPTEQVRAALLEAVARTPNTEGVSTARVLLLSYSDGVARYELRCWASAEEHWDASCLLWEKMKEVVEEVGLPLSSAPVRVQLPEDTKKECKK